MTAKNNKPKGKTPKAFRPYWIYGFLFAFLIFSYFLNSGSDTKEIGWLQFEQNMLSQGDVEQIKVVNKEVAEIYIKAERLKEEKYKA